MSERSDGLKAYRPDRVEGEGVTIGELHRRINDLDRRVRDLENADNGYAVRLAKLENDRKWYIAIAGAIGAVLALVITSIVGLVPTWKK